ncbi:MAG: LD-carboxypeptidase [Bdellovibrionaceae bacterium]|nr:LD-carboxypeptidase [Pseudobdellovibrionaceae bacterium]
MSSFSSIPAIQLGEKIRIIAPGMAFSKKELDLSCARLKDWGLKVEVPKGLLGSHPVSANSESARFAHLKSAMESDVRIVWAARGGYGSLHLLKYLKKMRAPKHKKLLIGFSDVTTLHQFVNEEWGWSSFHGPHADRLHSLSSARQNELQQMLFGKTTAVEFSLKPLNGIAKKNKHISGSMIGGNLITTQSTFGTEWQISTKNKILFLEDIGERGYRVDRVLEHMWSLRLLQTAKAIVFGPFVGGEEPGGGRSRVPSVLKSFAQKLNVPVYTGVESGHIPNSRTLPMHTHSVIAPNHKNFTLTVATGISK